MKRITKRLPIVISILILIVVLGFSQQPTTTTQPSTGGNAPPILSEDYVKESIDFVIQDTEDYGALESQHLYKILIDPFERAGEWTAKIPSDQGYVRTKEMWGVPGPLQEDPTDNQASVKTPPKYRNELGRYEEKYFEDRVAYGDTSQPLDLENEKILGVRVDFLQRGYNWFAIYPPTPIRLRGIVKNFEIWVAGRNRNHDLYIMVKDLYGNERQIFVSSLNFYGWKRLPVAVPTNITQQDFKYSTSRGLSFTGFLVKCTPEETYGTYYMYLDNLVAEVSRFYEENQDVSNPLDAW